MPATFARTPASRNCSAINAIVACPSLPQAKNDDGTNAKTRRRETNLTCKSQLRDRHHGTQPALRRTAQPHAGDPRARSMAGMAWRGTRRRSAIYQLGRSLHKAVRNFMAINFSPCSSPESPGPPPPGFSIWRGASRPERSSVRKRALFPAHASATARGTPIVSAAS